VHRGVRHTDFRQDLKKFDVPTLVAHGDKDRIVPIDISGRRRTS
jgi:pimeloyl-ACP methyl ester carboxylesterase